jgi:putative ABC transport system permease protein
MTRSEQESAPSGAEARIGAPTARPERVDSGRPLDARIRRSNTLVPSFRVALEALWANRLRSLLTTLGIFIGVAAVIIVVALTQGASALITSGLAGLGTNALLINASEPSGGGVLGGAGAIQSLTVSDATAIAAVPHVVAVSPLLSVNAQAVYSGQNWNTRVEGVYPAFQSIGNWQIAEGSWLTQSNEDGGVAVAVIGQTVSDSLFTPSATDPIGQMILLRGQPFHVVGVLKSKGALGAFNQDDVIFVPFSAASARLKNSLFVDQIQVQVDAATNVAQAQDAITAVLEEQHHIPAGGPDDFQIRSANQLVQTAQSFTQTLTFLLVGIAAISLIVGGIGIMNIMLVSVTERTREIGVRMAVGARRRDIRNQFLIEAVTLSSAGGIIGILIGLSIGLVLTHAFNLPFVLNLPSILLAFGVSAVVGVIFGLYPAVRASQLDPIVALRTE